MELRSSWEKKLFYWAVTGMAEHNIADRRRNYCTLTPEQYRNWFNQYSDKSRYKTLRVGQAFCNDYNLTDPDLFYQSNNNEAFEMIMNAYVIEEE